MITKVRETLNRLDLEGIIITSYYNRRYISGFTGSKGVVIITHSNAYIILDGKYILQAKEQCIGYEIVLRNKELGEIIKDICVRDKVNKLGFEENYISFKEYRNMYNNELYKLVAIENIIEDIRAIKKSSELELIREACRIGDTVLQDTVNYIRENKGKNLTECDIAIYLEKRILDLGCRSSFDIIVVSGERGALPHGRPTDRVIRSGELITIDFGVIYKGYRSDITRTFALDHLTDSKLQEIYEIVQLAQYNGVKGAKANLVASGIDRICRDVIDKSGYGKYFVHGTGHGIGLEGHECEVIGPSSNKLIRENSVITIEPGIYIEGLGGVRIEDTVVIGKDGVEILTKFPRELIII